jgi:molybdopterin-guanine dinucleotide biosynthesis protein A
MIPEAFILIGGRSTRFGSPKALLTLDGQPLLDRTADTIRAALPETRITLVTSGPEQFFGLGTDLPFIFDIYEGRGPWGGLHAALAYARTEWILVLACDYPFISSDLLKRLAQYITPGLDAVVPIQPDEKIQPLCVFYRVKPCLKIVEGILERNRPTPPLRDIFESVTTRFVKFDELGDLPNAENLFQNINAPGDLDSC